MGSNSNLRELITQYLLGSLSDEEQELFEERYFSDDLLFADLLTVEAELIGRYERGELDEPERARFEYYFLRSDERRRRLRIGVPMIERGNEETAGTRLEETGIRSPSWWQKLFSWLGLK